jgi:hypothetical protein
MNPRRRRLERQRRKDRKDRAIVDRFCAGVNDAAEIPEELQVRFHHAFRRLSAVLPLSRPSRS